MKILIVTSRYPWPPRRGDQMRALQMLDFLSSEHEVTLLTPAPGRGQPPPPEKAPYRIEHYLPRGGAARFSGMARSVVANQPLQSGLFHQVDLGRKIRELAPRHDLGILQLVRLALHVKDFGDTPIIVDLIDSLSLNFSLRAAVDRWWMKLPLKAEARLLAIAERRLAERAERLLVVCERDRQALVNRFPPKLAGKVSVVRLSVRDRKFEPPEAHERLRPEGDDGPILAITGNLGYFVNVDAVTWWLQDVWPTLRQVRPDVRVVIAGDRPTASLRRAIAKAGVRLIEAPRDMRSIISQATLSIAPMRCGSGVPIKVLEAWAVGVPVLASSWAVAGTSGRQGEDFLLVGQHAIEWVSAIVHLLDNPSAAQWLVENGRRRLATDYSRETVRQQLLNVIASLDLAKALPETTAVPVAAP
jgi:glycosyltransferase involved in cell wall biosynthesis